MTEENPFVEGTEEVVGETNVSNSVSSEENSEVNVDENTDLAVVEDDHATVENEELRREILSLRDKSEENYWELGVKLEHVYDGGLYHGWGFDSWKEYVEQELDLHTRKAQYLVKLQGWFTTMTPAIQEWMRSIGWTKARMLMHVVTKENAKEWRKRVEGKTVAQIDEMLKLDKQQASGGEGGGEGGEEDPEERPVKWSASLFVEQKGLVDLAIEKAKELAESDKTGHALTMICQEYLATNTTTMSRNDMLKNMERITGLKIIAMEVREGDEQDNVVYGMDYLDESK